jgi:hypothetical protein
LEMEAESYWFIVRTIGSLNAKRENFLCQLNSALPATVSLFILPPSRIATTKE